MPLPLADRKSDLAPSRTLRRRDPLQRSPKLEGPAFHKHARALGLEDIVSKRLDAPYSPSDRGLWLKTKRLNRDEFVVVGWTDPEGSRPFIGALVLGYYNFGDRRFMLAGRYRDAG